MRTAIVGVGGHGRELREYLFPGEDVVFLDDHALPLWVNGAPVVGSTQLLADAHFLSQYQIIVAVGDCKRRGELSREVIANGGKLATAIHASAIVAKNAHIGRGTVVMPYALVGPNAYVGDYFIINKGARISHDSLIKNGVNISDDVTLSTTVGEDAFIGLHVAVIPKVKIGARSIVGAGAVVTQEVPPDTTVAGVPARIIKHQGTHG